MSEAGEVSGQTSQETQSISSPEVAVQPKNTLSRRELMTAMAVAGIGALLARAGFTNGSTGESGGNPQSSEAQAADKEALYQTIIANAREIDFVPGEDTTVYGDVLIVSDGESSLVVSPAQSENESSLSEPDQNEPTAVIKGTKFTIISSPQNRSYTLTPDKSGEAERVPYPVRVIDMKTIFTDEFSLGDISEAKYTKAHQIATGVISDLIQPDHANDLYQTFKPGAPDITQADITNVPTVNLSTT